MRRRPSAGCPAAARPQSCLKRLRCRRRPAQRSSYNGPCRAGAGSLRRLPSPPPTRVTGFRGRRAPQTGAWRRPCAADGRPLVASQGPAAPPRRAQSRRATFRGRCRAGMPGPAQRRFGAGDTGRARPTPEAAAPPVRSGGAMSRCARRWGSLRGRLWPGSRRSTSPGFASARLSGRCCALGCLGQKRGWQPGCPRPGGRCSHKRPARQ
mmetsp:Transcript_411/g.1485  ORF Transcript_411/g.1485 Transcript_411/m.1485 type:complete len:209 (-) Transcript_411:478-1104(-)